MSDPFTDSRADVGAPENEHCLSFAQIDLVAGKPKRGWIERRSLCEQPARTVEAAGLEPYWTGESAKERALEYAKQRMRRGPGEIWVINSEGSVESVIRCEREPRI